MISGAFGVGKSRILCTKVCEQASVPGTVHGLFRKTGVSLTRTTLRTLLYPDGKLPPVLPVGTYKHIKSGPDGQQIRIHGGGTIMYGGCDDPVRIGSMNLVSAYIDESIEIDEDEFTMILGRLRMGAPTGYKVVRQLGHATNPGSPSHWLHKRYLEGEHPGREVIQTKTTDNPFLPADYIEAMNELTGARRQRFVEGLWVPFEGLVYGDVWNRDTCVMTRDRSEFSEIIVLVDAGYTNPAVLLEAGIDSDGRMHVLSEFHKRRVLQDDLIAEMKRLTDADLFIVDPSAAGLIASMREKGLAVVPADNDVFGGIAKTQDRLKVQGDGKTRLTFDPGCTSTIIEFETYAWKANAAKDTVVKEFDHAPDAIRYGVNYLDGTRINPTVHAIGGEQEKSNDQEIRELITSCETSTESNEVIRALQDQGEWTPQEGWSEFRRINGIEDPEG